MQGFWGFRVYRAQGLKGFGFRNLGFESFSSGLRLQNMGVSGVGLWDLRVADWGLGFRV